MTQNVLSVPSISCGHCKAAIEKAVGELAGVESVSADVAEKTVSVSFDDAQVDHGAIVTAIADAGYKVV